MTRHAPRIPLPPPGPMALQLTAARTALASVIMAAPVVSARVFGTDTATAQRVVWLVRMAAVRDGALGVGGLAAARRGGSAAVPWLLGGAVSDAVDAVVLAQALKQGRVKGVGPAGIVPLGAVAAVAGVVTALRLRRR
jgi:hypothetical protein